MTLSRGLKSKVNFVEKTGEDANSLVSCPSLTSPKRKPLAVFLSANSAFFKRRCGVQIVSLCPAWFPGSEISQPHGFERRLETLRHHSILAREVPCEII